ncbi:hypothetical protein ABEB36_013594 [Hypothenemus hampei]|uniref:Protein TAPT1 homolog n=1 Tax=Hypothenemus hampei TaxID=57062 RepID=A0ABD1E523_HYPHA
MNDLQKNSIEQLKHERAPSLLKFIKTEITRDYLLENDEERFSTGREKFYSFMKIPKEVEKFMVYGVMHCVDSFLFVYTYLTLRVVVALYSLITRPLSKCFGYLRVQQPNRGILNPAEICDLLKAVILIFSTMVLWVVDTSVIYHLIKSQSVIKLYIFYNMLDVGDKLLISLGQDALDALFWTATEPKGRKREHLGVIPHLFLAIVYVIMHSILILFQATTLNVAMNANNKALLTIMMSNNFVELKGSVFKKFDKNNLFQVSCSDTMKAYQWKKIDVLWPLMFDAVAVLLAEVFVDWIKHAFITRFNELNVEVYKDYRTSIAYDVTHRLDKQAFCGHSDIVARRMGFIALPLGVLFARVLLTSINIENLASYLIFFIGYLCLWSWKIITTIIIFGKACSIIDQHKLERTSQNSPVNQDKFRNTATSPHHPIVTQQSRKVIFKNGFLPIEPAESDLDLNVPVNDLISSAIFANSTVDLKNVKLNDELLNEEHERCEELNEDMMTRSVPDIQEKIMNDEMTEIGNTKNEFEIMKKSESEPSLVNLSEC